MQDDYRMTRRMRTVMWVMALAVLVPSCYGFGTKFLEFVALFRGDVDGAFAISPILNYLLASVGFLLLFGWAALGGMFRDVERPKYAMMENEALLDVEAPWREKIGLQYPAGARARSRKRKTASDRHRFRGFYDHD
jgi:hypothetical protein